MYKYQRRHQTRKFLTSNDFLKIRNVFKGMKINTRGKGYKCIIKKFE